MDIAEEKYIAEKIRRFLEYHDLYSALAELPEKQYEAIWMWAEGLTIKQIATQLGITRQAVETRIGRAIENLRAMLHECVE